jgi:pyridoxal phosphate enzyme (YggS family)
MDYIQENIVQVQKRIAQAAERSHRAPEDVRLVAVTKGVDATAIQSAFDYGIREFGENRVQEASSKISELVNIKPYSTWHMVGHVQTNKAKIVTEIFNMVQSVDSIRLATVLNDKAKKALPVLLQVNISAELTKHGVSVEEVNTSVEQIGKLTNLELKGLMTIAPLTDNPEEVRPVFRKLRELRDSLGLEHLSMGMTDDFEVAIEEGATIVRIGRAIFQR